MRLLKLLYLLLFAFTFGSTKEEAPKAVSLKKKKGSDITWKRQKQAFLVEQKKKNQEQRPKKKENPPKDKKGKSKWDEELPPFVEYDPKDTIEQYERKRAERYFFYTELRRKLGDSQANMPPFWSRLPLGAHPPPPAGVYERALLVYAGPTSAECDARHALYHRNFQFFLHQGLPCSYPTYWGTSQNNRPVHFDVAIVLTNETYAIYEQQLQAAAAACPSVRVVLRRDRCYDLEATRTVLKTLDVARYDYYLKVNCGLVGPLLLGDWVARGLYWPMLFIEPLRDGRTKLVGLTGACEFYPHVQSFLFALDRRGLRTVRDAGVIFDCKDILEKKDGVRALVYMYEVGMSKAIVDAGYEIATINATSDFPRFRHSPATYVGPPPVECTNFWASAHALPADADRRPEGIPFWKVTSYMPAPPGLDSFLEKVEAYHRERRPEQHHVLTRVCGYDL